MFSHGLPNSVYRIVNAIRIVCTALAMAGGSFAASVDPVALSAARSLYELGKLADAQQAFEILAAAEPKDAEVNFFLGELALRRNELEKAVSFFESAVRTAPGVSRYHHRLGDAFGRAARAAGEKGSIFSGFSNARKCVAAYRRAVEVDPDNIAARYSLFTYYRAAPGIVGGSADKAAAEAAEIMRQDPDRGRIATAALAVTQKKYDRARAILAEFKPVALAAVKSDRAYLSDVEWTEGKVGWGQPARNHMWFDETSNPGVILIVHGRLYAKGLYAHSPSRYAFPLDGKWKTFSALVGLEDGAHRQGSAIFTVRGDGRELFRSAMLRVGASEQVQVDVAGVKELELIAEPGEGHNHNSWAVWVEPLVRR